MKMTFNIENPKELKSALNNAIFTYQRIVFSSYLGLTDSIPIELNKMLEKNGYKTIDDKYNFLKQRLNILQNFYNQLSNF